ncbi:serine/threonine-protein kinase PknK [Acidobacteriota bacterium]
MIGQRVSHFNILKKIGQGGMGEVYLAADTKLERKVALKFLPKELTSDKDACIRFEREAKAAAALNHPNIVTIYEINEINGQIYIAMEYLDGLTLKEKMSRQGMKQIGELIDIAIQVGEGLKEAHQTGIVHRDIKPENIVLDRNNRVKILDFGLAKLRGAAKITEEICRIGTVNYMSPEQARGDELDSRTDIWSFGVVLYELATGELPFKGDKELTVIKSITSKSPLPPAQICPGIPPELGDIILRCLHKDPEKRSRSVEALLSDLQNLTAEINRNKQSQVEAGLHKKKRAGTQETEQRQATVVFSEICGYENMLKELGNEETAAIMNRCFHMVTTIVENHDGRIDKIMQGSMIALFGVPVAIEDAPKEAVNAAIAMRSNLQRLNREDDLKISLDIRTGINSGMVISGAMEQDETKVLGYNVMGDTITRANQLKDLTSKGKIVAGPLTYRQTKDDFEYRKIRSIIFPRKSDLTALYELLSTKENIYRPVVDMGRLIKAKMVGRDKELDKLRLHIMQVINGKGSILRIIGEAGIGKSRLAAELKKVENLKKVTFLEGRAVPVGKNISYHPFIDILKNRAEISEEDSRHTAFSKLETAIVTLDPEMLYEILPLIATMMKLPLTGRYAEQVKGIKGEVLEKLILKTVRRLLIKIAEKKPAVLVFEDLHWADTSSVELLQSLLPLAENHRLLFVLISRPTRTGGQFTAAIREKYAGRCEEIVLQRLKRKECQKMIRGLIEVGGLNPQTERAIIDRAEGNPFFIEEVVRSFLDAGIIEQGKEKFKTTDRIDAVMVPETIYDVIMVRIDRLDEKTRTLLKEAAVIGRSFNTKILMAVTGIGTAVDDRLAYLQKAEIIEERRRAGEQEYQFKHSLTRQVAYDSILSKKREELHLKVAQTIESVFADQLPGFYGMLALHYSKAGCMEKAGEYLEKAAEEALKTAASGEALHYYREALKVYRRKHGEKGNPDAIAGLEWNIARVFFNKGHMREAVKHFDRVLKLWGQYRPKNIFVRMFNFIGDRMRFFKYLYLPHKNPGRIPSPRENNILEIIYQRSMALASIDTSRLLIDTHRFLKTIHKYDLSKVRGGIHFYASFSALLFFSGTSFAISRKMLNHARGYIKPRESAPPFAFTFWELLFDTLTGNWKRQLPYDETVININLQRGDLFTTSGYLFFCGIIKTGQGSFSGARIYIEKLAEIAETFVSDQARLFKYALNARYLLKRRKLFDALQEVEAGLSLADLTGHKPELLSFTGIKAHIRILQGNMDRAEKTVLRANRLASQHQLSAPLHCGSFHLSRFLFYLRRLEIKAPSGEKARAKEAHRFGQAALKTAAKNAPYLTETQRLVGTYHWLCGKRKKALSCWGKSIKTGEQLGDRPELARTYMEVGRRLRERHSPIKRLGGISAGEYLQRAWSFFKEMDLQWDLDQLEKITTR